MQSSTPTSLLLAAAMTLGICGCPSGGPNSLIKTAPPDAKTCAFQKDEVQKAHAEVSAQFDYALTSFGADASLDELRSVKTNLDDIQRDYGLATFNLCQDFEAKRISQANYETRRQCLDEALWAMRAMQSELKQTANAQKNAKQVAWSVDGKMSWMREALACRPDRSSSTHEAAAALQPSKGLKPSDVSMTAYLLCQRQGSDGTFADVPDCNAQPLTEGDRIKIGAQVTDDAHIYIVNYNDRGQFQVLFPAPNQRNTVPGGQPLFLPDGGESWLVLDDVSGVTEYLQLVASRDAIPELEARRGMNLPPSDDGKLDSQAVATRGILEPFTHRGFTVSPQKKTHVNVGAAQIETVPIKVDGLGVTVVEFEVIHN